LDESVPPRVLANFPELGVYGVSFSPDGALLAVASEDKKVRLFDTIDWQLKQTFADHARPVTGVKFSGDGRRLASCSRDATARIYAIPSGDCLATLKVRHNNIPELVSVAFSPDDKLLALASFRAHTVWLFDAQTYNEVDFFWSEENSVQT